MSDALNAVLQRGLAKDPHDRFPSRRAFLRALRAVMNNDQDAGGLLVVNMDDTIIFSDGATPRSEAADRSVAERIA